VKTIATIILSLFLFWPSLQAQTEAPMEKPPNLSIKARFFTPASTPLFEGSKQGFFFRDTSLVPASPLSKLNLSSIKTTLEMDSTATYFTISQMMDGKPIGIPTVVSIDDYVQLSLADRKGKLFKKIATGRLQADEESEASQSFELIGADIAGQRVSLRVRGNVNITGKFRSEDRSKQTNTNNTNQSNTFQIEQKQAFKIEGKIGDRISIQVDQDSERDFDFENNMEIYYNGNEDEIIQKIEAGNISLSLPGTKLAMFSGQNNGLFGLKALAKVGPVDITAIASLERGRKEKLSLNGNSESSEVTIEDYQRKANTYFYINNFYRRKSYPLDPKKVAFIRPGRSIEDIRVYKYTTANFENRITNFAKIYNNPNTDAEPVTSRQVIQLVQGPDGDFTLEEDLGFIRMNTPVQSNEVLAIAYRDVYTGPRDNTTNPSWAVPEYSPGLDPLDTYQEGNDVALGTPGTADTLILKMIKPDGALPSDPTWDLEWKNVYYLKTTGINKEGFDLKIKKSLGGTGEDVAEDGISFLQIFGLDRTGVGAEATPDGVIDMEYSSILNLYRGELIFPYLNPFAVDSAVTSQPIWMTNALGQPLGNGGNPNLKDYPQYQSNSFYVNPSTNNSDYTKDTKFTIHVSYANQSSTFNLGFNVIEGSEEVTLNGVPLERGAARDYTIDYFTGQLIILNEAALAPGANLDIKYELNEFFQLDKKVILGSRAEMKFGENDNSFIGLSAIYFSKSSIDEKVRVGKEPMENFIWDLNAKITKELPWLTRGLDWLPVIKTDAPSSVTFTGEIAQVIPNPNTSENKDLGDVGVAYLDDFEGSRREAQLSIIRGAWGMASIPADGTNRGNYERAFTYWYNPYNRVLTKQIWPNKETSAQAQNDVTDILVLNVVPDSSFAVRDGGVAPGNAWGGIMRGLSSGYYDQSQSKFLEMWVKGDQGRLHVDLGYITEDLQESGQEWTQEGTDFENDPDDLIHKGFGVQPDTEDKPTNAFPQGDGYIDETEDLGLDGLPYTTPENPALYGWHHPSWERYEFDPTVLPIDYRHINGTEGNLQIEGGTYPNSEDLNNNDALDTRNAYFSIDVDLTTDEYIAGRTAFNDGTETGWKLVRVPLTEFIRTGDDPDAAQWTQVKFARLWMDEVPMGGAALQIATVDIVGNEWQERGVYSQYDGFEKVVTDSLHGTLNVVVINTEDNPSRYNSEAVPGSYNAPPKGVSGILDPITQLRSKEQSLVIRADDLNPGYTVVADKLFQGSTAKNFIHYGTMKMFIHGWDRSQGGVYESTFTNYLHSDDQGSDVEFFFRFGETDDNFYEIRKPIFPGWDDRNHLNLNLAELANFKLALEDSLFIISQTYEVGNDSIGFQDSTAMDTLYWSELPTNFKYARKTLEDGTIIAVKGRPSLDRVKLLKTGFRNLSDAPMSGELWLDELRLTDVEKNTATAYRANVNLQFADVARINMDIQRDDADFHNVQEQFGSGDNSVATNISATLSAHKLLPSSWGVNIPISASYRQSEKQPKYITASDIRVADLDKSLQDTLETMTTRSESYNWNVSLSRSEKSDHWLPKYTLDAMNFKVGASNSLVSDPRKKEIKSEKLDAGFGYKLNLGNKNTVAPFQFMETLPVIGKTLAETEIAYLPTNVGFDGTVLESKNASLDRNPNVPLSETHQLTMSRRYNIDWALSNSLTAKFNASLSNDLDSLKDRKEDIVRNLDFGHLGNYKETYNLSWTPKIMKMLSPSFSYSSNFSAVDKIKASSPGLDLNVSSNTSANMSLTVSEVFGIIHKPENSKQSTRSRGGNNTDAPARGRGRGRDATPPPEQSKDDAGKAGQDADDEKSSLTKVLDFTYATLDRIDPISLNLTQGRRSQSYRQIAAYDSIVVPIYTDSTVTYVDSLVVRELDINNVSYSYRMGLDMGSRFIDHPDATNPLVTGDDINLTLRSGLRLSKTLSTKLTFTLGKNSSIANRSQGEVIKDKMDYLPSGSLFGMPKDEVRSLGSQGIPFPAFTLRYSGLKDIEWLKKYITSASLDMNYGGKKSSNQEKGIVNNESYSIGFSPLIGLNVSGKKKINGSLTYNVGKNISNTLSEGNTTSQQSLNQSVNASVSYAHSGGMKIALPMMEDKYLENNIDFRLEISFTNEQAYTGTEQDDLIEFEKGKFTKSLSIRPGIQYSFTDKVSGNVSYDYRISETTLNGQQNVGDFQFGVNIQIKG
jgi:cell surface protein SprA